MSTDSYLTIAPQIRGLAAAHGHRVRVRFAADLDPSRAAGTVLKLTLPTPLKDESAEARAASIAACLKAAWGEGAPLPAIIRLA